MNARQKAKHYKKLYESTKLKPINFQVHNFKTSYVQACKLVRHECYLQDSEYKDAIEKELSQELAKGLKNLMDIKVEYYPEDCLYKVYGTVRVFTGVYY